MEPIPLVNRDAIVGAIVDSKVSPDARNLGGALVEAWVDEYEEIDAGLAVHAVEVPFYIPIDKKTYVVGQQDAIFADEQGFLSGEWKTRRAPKLKRDGDPYAGETEDDWLEEISSGPQLATYALAAHEGRFHVSPQWPALVSEHPRLMVRCVLKTRPPLFWPTNPARGLFEFSPADLDATRQAYLAKATAIRAMRQAGFVPWQLIGAHCKQYNRMCDQYERCKHRLYAPLTPRAWHHPDDHAPDPGYEVCKLLQLDPADPELVVLSQSAYQSYSRCPELGRTSYGGHYAREASYELQVGTATHAGLAEFYRQIKSTPIDANVFSA